MEFPDTAEDRLVAEYHARVGGELLLEVPVGLSGAGAPRRIDAILIPENPERVHVWGSLGSEELHERIHGRSVHLIEAKIRLNRSVIGQIVAGAALLEWEYEPAVIRNVVVCASGHADLERVCEARDIQVEIFEQVAGVILEQDPESDLVRDDIRRAPDSARRTAFLAGWSAAVDGRLYSTVWEKKTHANMGNLFGWIYGDQPREFRRETWERYVAALRAEEERT